MNSTIKNNLFGLSEETIELILSTINKNKKVEKIVIFGSRAKGNFKKGSDIDLAIFAKDLNFNEFMKIKVDVGELMLPYSIDVVDYYNLENKELKEHILRVGETFSSE